MQIKFQNISEGNEYLLFIKIISDEGREISKMPFYSNSELDKKCPGLVASLKDIQQLLKMIYESGKKNEKIEFKSLEEEEL